MSFSTLYIELDCLLDTRLAQLYSYGEEYAEAALMNGYLERLEDKFPNVDPEQFSLDYKNRTKTLLQHALMTPMVELVADFVNKTQLNYINSSLETTPKVVVNTYPYDLTIEEQKILLIGLYTHINPECPIEFIHESMEDITPSKVKSDYAVVVMYRYDRWLEHHSETGDFAKITCPDVALIAPRIFFHGLPDQETVGLAQSMKMDIFDMVETTCGLLIHLSLYPISFFSINLANGEIPIQKTDGV